MTGEVRGYRADIDELRGYGQPLGTMHAETRIGLAHAIAMQGHVTEARELLAPDLARYHEIRQRGASGIRFHRNFAHALYVSAITQPDDEAGRVRRVAALADAADLLVTSPQISTTD